MWKARGVREGDTALGSWSSDTGSSADAGVVAGTSHPGRASGSRFCPYPLRAGTGRPEGPGPSHRLWPEPGAHHPLASRRALLGPRAS